MSKPLFVKFSDSKCKIVINQDFKGNNDELIALNDFLSENANHVKEISLETIRDGCGEEPPNVAQKTDLVVCVVTTLLHKLVSLDSLSLPNKRIRFEVLYHLISMLPRSLTYLDLTGSNMQYALTRQIAKFISSDRCGLKFLSFERSYFEIPQDHLLCIATSLAKNTTLKCLQIDGIESREVGCIALCDVISKNTTLEDLRCYTTAVDWFLHDLDTYASSDDFYRPTDGSDVFASKMASAIANNQTLSYLSLPCLTCYQTCNISKSIFKNTSLFTLIAACKPMNRFEEIFLKNGYSLRKIHYATNRNNWKQRWHTVLFKTVLEIVLSLGTLDILNPYICMWTLDFLPEMENVAEYVKIEYINSVAASCNKEIAKRNADKGGKKRT